jgi:hypothetical protein
MSAFDYSFTNHQTFISRAQWDQDNTFWLLQNGHNN